MRRAGLWRGGVLQHIAGYWKAQSGATSPLDDHNAGLVRAGGQYSALCVLYVALTTVSTGNQAPACCHSPTATAKPAAAAGSSVASAPAEVVAVLAAAASTGAGSRAVPPALSMIVVLSAAAGITAPAPSAAASRGAGSFPVETAAAVAASMASATKSSARWTIWRLSLVWGVGGGWAGRAGCQSGVCSVRSTAMRGGARGTPASPHRHQEAKVIRTCSHDTPEPLGCD